MKDENVLFATMDEADVNAEREEIPMKKFLAFNSDGMLLGIDVEYMEEIITNYMITRLPMVPDYIRGIINLRGQIIPIIDVRMRLGRPAQESNCVIVLNIDGTGMGIMVDTVDQIADVRKDQLQPMPSNNTNRFMCGMCTLQENKTMMILDCPMLLEQ